METSLFLAALAGEKTPRAPFWFMRQAGRYLPEYRALRAEARDFMHFCLSPDMATEATLQPIRRFGMDAAILFADILLIPHALGREVKFVAGEGPRLPPITTPQEVAALTYQPETLLPVYETLRRVRTQLPPETALIGFAGSPWTVACYMLEGGGSRDFATARRFAIGHPQAFSHLISSISDATIAYLSAQVEAGAQALQLFDSWAGIAPEAEFRAHIIAPTMRIVQALRTRFPHVPIIGFPKSAGALTVDYAALTGVQGISVDAGMPLEFARNQIASHVTLQGNLDNILLGDDINGALAQAARILQAWETRPFIFNLGHGMLPHTPVAHVERLSAMLRGEEMTGTQSAERKTS